MPKSGKNSCDIGCKDEELKSELRHVIELMGPETPQITSAIVNEVSETKFLKNFQNTHSLNTPRDVSEMSSFPTDSVEVYLEPKPCRCVCDLNAEQEVMNRQVKEMGNSALTKISSFFKMKSSTKECERPIDLYRINILQPPDESSPPKRVIFDRLEEMPRPCCTNAATNTSVCMSLKKQKMSQNSTPVYWNKSVYGNSGIPQDRSCESNSLTNILMKHKSRNSQKQTFYSELKKDQLPPHVDNIRDMARVDVYYFDHGNAAYFQTTDSPPLIMTEILAEKTEHYTTRFWAEFFGSIHIGFSFLTSFVLQFIRFILSSLVRPLTVGLAQLISDYCLKPLLATLFNAVLQPPLIFTYNVATSVRDICQPLAEGIGFFLREIAALIRALRCFEYRKDTNLCSNCKQPPTATSTVESDLSKASADK
ncbi:PREDICTED: uncharacterized protein LOC108556344 [Nicrophorus vespilloides]|uniref:Uncharacterized protein LOC108556344 n=1 Tax=Nicrophorus vespilloides TaxID=110193 RepID=A0ABM1M007_NICVS|nr:PREDICTED: uncharacterized protein LOC108556344 [Nicrophorus vespilloides]